MKINKIVWIMGMMMLMLSSLNNAYWCFQENTNETKITITDSYSGFINETFCNLNYSGKYTLWNTSQAWMLENASIWYDGNWTSKINKPGTTQNQSRFFITYYKPLNALNSSKWITNPKSVTSTNLPSTNNTELKNNYNISAHMWNISDIGCWNEGQNFLNFSVISSAGGDPRGLYECWNGTNWRTILRCNITDICTTDFPYVGFTDIGWGGFVEEAMWWNISSSDWCYQETANISSLSDGSCELKYTGKYNIVSGNYGYFYINYTIPNSVNKSASKNSLWQIKHGILSTYNISIPLNCWNSPILQLRLVTHEINGEMGENNSWGECYNGTSWNMITSAEQSSPCSTSTTGNATMEYLYDGDWNTFLREENGVNWRNQSSTACDNKTRLYEEAMWWDMVNNSINLYQPNSSYMGQLNASEIRYENWNSLPNPNFWTEKNNTVVSARTLAAAVNNNRFTFSSSTSASRNFYVWYTFTVNESQFPDIRTNNITIKIFKTNLNVTTYALNTFGCAAIMITNSSGNVMTTNGDGYNKTIGYGTTFLVNSKNNTAYSMGCEVANVDPTMYIENLTIIRNAQDNTLTVSNDSNTPIYKNVTNLGDKTNWTLQFGVMTRTTAASLSFALLTIGEINYTLDNKTWYSVPMILNYSNVNFSANITGTNLFNTTLYVVNASNISQIINQTTINISSSGIISVILNLADGVYSWFWELIDTFGNIITSALSGNITIDTTDPIISFIEPTYINGYNTSINGIPINITVSDINFNYTVINLYNSTNILYNTSNLLYINFTPITISQIYYYNATAYDNASHVISTETRNVTIDLIPPWFNQTVANSSNPWGQWNATINATDNYVFGHYSLNDTANFIINEHTGYLQNNTALINNRTYWINLTINDTVNNKNNTIFWVLLQDSVYPTWNQTITSNIYWYYNWPWSMQVNATDQNLDEYWINESTNFQIDITTGIIQNKTNLLINKPIYWLNVTANDTSNNKISMIFNITVMNTSITNAGPSNNTFLNENYSVNISANFSSAGAKNATLYIYNRTSLWDSIFFDLAGLMSGTISTIVDFTSGVYSWFWGINPAIGQVNNATSLNVSITLDNTTGMMYTNFTEGQVFNYSGATNANITAQFYFRDNDTYIEAYRIYIDNILIKNNDSTHEFGNRNVSYNMSTNATLYGVNSHILNISWWSAGLMNYQNTIYNFTIQQPPTSSGLYGMYPNNNTQFNYTDIGYWVTFNTSYINMTCNVTLDSVVTDGAITGIMFPNISASVKNSTYFIPSIVATAQGTHYYNWTCSNNVGRATSPTYLFYTDTIAPNVNQSTWGNGLVIQQGMNITGQWNISDDVMLYSYNFTIDGSQIKYNKTLQTTNVSLNLSYPITTNITNGPHQLTLLVFDGHTANKLKNKYLFDSGAIFDDGLIISTTEINGLSRTISIKNKDSSFGDKYIINESYDRFTFDYTPSKKNKKSFEFIVTSTMPLDILEAPQYQQWLVTGNNWIDFLLEDQPNEKISIEKIDEYNAKVLISGLNPNKKFKFKTIGELNIKTYNYSFYTFTTTVTDIATVLGSSSWTANARFDKGTNVYSIGNLNRSFNNTDYMITSGYIVSNVTVFPFYELWNISYNTPTINTSWVTTVNVSWTINDTPYSMNYSQTIYALNVNNCSNATWAKALTMLLYDESITNPEPKFVNGTINIWLQMTPTGISGSPLNVSMQFSNVSNVSICIFPNSSSVKANSIIEYYGSADLYTTRHYYLNNQTLSNETLVLPLYLLPEGCTATTCNYSVIQTKVYDKSTGDSVSGAYVELLRYYPQLGGFRLVEMMQSDSLGYSTFSLIPYNTLYKWIVIYNNVVKLETESSTMYTGTKLLPISLSEDVLRDLQYFGDVASNVTWVGNTAVFEWVDTNGIVNKGKLQVYRENGWGKVLLYQGEIESASGILLYPVVENMSDNTYYAVGTLDPGLDWVKVAIKKASMGIRAKWGDTVLLGMMLLVIVCAFMFLDLGIAGIVTGTMVALTAGAILGFLSLSTMELVSLAIIGGILIARANRTQ